MQPPPTAESPFEPATTFRQTQVVIIPNEEEIVDNFRLFDSVIETINACRRNSRDFVLDANLEKLEDERAGVKADRDWRCVW